MALIEYFIEYFIRPENIFVMNNDKRVIRIKSQSSFNAFEIEYLLQIEKTKDRLVLCKAKWTNSCYLQTLEIKSCLI